MNGQYGDMYNQLALVAYVTETRREPSEKEVMPERSESGVSRRRRLAHAIHQWASGSVATGWRRLRVRATIAGLHK